MHNVAEQQDKKLATTFFGRNTFRIGMSAKNRIRIGIVPPVYNLLVIDLVNNDFFNFIVVLVIAITEHPLPLGFLLFLSMP